ncbi:MAG TPA: CPBP family intramembrane glutamic endopeptidase [Pirellulales bacterium]|nr:CPBP family intramembrane glutamic endopeptidase [Pirellulales bacterium]
MTVTERDESPAFNCVDATRTAIGQGPTAMLVVLTVLPLAVIAGQLGFGATGIVGYSLYKIALLVPPLIYCRMYGLSVRHDVFKLHHWRRGIKQSVCLGILALALFWGAYFTIGDWLLDKPAIAQKIGERFGVTASTVLLVAPITIILNSLLEEFFYRGFAFGQLVRRNKVVAYLLPATIFTLQHLMFTNDWAGWGVIVLGVVALFVFALVLEAVYTATDTLVAAWLIHVFGDVAMMGVAVELLLYGGR